MTTPQSAKLQFLKDWRTLQQGVIAKGQQLIIEYDPERLPHCRLNWRGAEVWDIHVFIKFHPGGQFNTGSVLGKVRASEHGMVVGLVPMGYEVTVPLDAQQVEIWFRNFYDVSQSCEAWDSRYGQNYWYDVVRDEA